MTVAEALVEHEEDWCWSPMGSELSGGDDGSACSEDEDAEDYSSGEEEADEEPSNERDKTEVAVGEKGERKPLSCYLCNGPHLVRYCPQRARLSAILQVYEESEAERERDEQPSVARLGAIVSYKSVAAEDHKTSQWGKGDDGTESESSIDEHGHEDQLEALELPRGKCGSRRKARRRARARLAEQVGHTPSNEGVARTSGGVCHGLRDRGENFPNKQLESGSSKLVETRSSKLVGTGSSKLVETRPSKLVGTRSSKLVGTGSSWQLEGGSRDEPINRSSRIGTGVANNLVVREDLGMTRYESAPSYGCWNSPEGRWTANSCQQDRWPGRPPDKAA